jgi:hypothetical protein
MLQALAEADAAQQLHPIFPRRESDRPVELPQLPLEMMERVSVSPNAPRERAPEPRMDTEETDHAMSPRDADQDIIMTQ